VSGERRRTGPECEEVAISHCARNARCWSGATGRNSMCKANPAAHISPSWEYWTALGDSPVPSGSAHSNPCAKGVALLGIEVSSGWYRSAKAKYRAVRPISNKYCEGKFEKHFGERVTQNLNSWQRKECVSGQTSQGRSQYEISGIPFWV